MSRINQKKSHSVREISPMWSCDHVQNVSLTPDKVLNTCIYGTPFCVSYTADTNF